MKIILAYIIFAFFACCSPAYASNARLGGTRAKALDESLWNHSVWISASDAKVRTGGLTDDWLAAEGASWFVSTTINDKKVVSAKWMTTGLGVYDIYVNGKLVGDEILKPGCTHWQKTRLSFTYDITDMINRRAGAENMFSAQVNPGWWADKIMTPWWYDGFVGKKCAFRSVLELIYDDGSVEYYGTDRDNWKAGVAGPVKRAAIFDGELYDARENEGHFCLDRLSRPEENKEFKGKIYPSEGAEVYYRKDLAFSPARAYVWRDIAGIKENEYGKVVIDKVFSPREKIRVRPGETLVVDFGQNAAAVPSFVFKAKEGTVLTCLPAEILNDGNGAQIRGMDGPEGSVHRKNLRKSNAFTLQYTFAGEGREMYIPRYTFFGYRYLSITATDEVVFEQIESVPVTSIAAKLETGHITTGNKDINQLISNTMWSMYSNYLTIPSDCPQRDERLGWAADTQVFCETGSFFADTKDFMRKWMRDVRDTQGENGEFACVAPLAQYGSEQMHFGWSDSGVIVPWTIYKQFGDREIINENWNAMERYMDLVNRTRYDFKAHLDVNKGFQFADWLSYEPLESYSGASNMRDSNGNEVKKPEAIDYWNFLSASYWVMDALMMRDMAAATDRDAQKYEKMAEEAKSYIREKFLYSDGLFKTPILNTMQTPALFALKNDILEGTAKDNMIKRLRSNFEQRGNCLSTGFLGTSILMATLTENDMSDIAYELLFQRRNPSWLYSIDNGATTIWERWNSYMIEVGMGPNGMNSFNHYAYGCVCEWLWETAAGISSEVTRPGFSHIIMKPVPDKRLGYLEAEYNSASGMIRSCWHYKGDMWIWEFEIPDGATASVTIPGETVAKDYAAGKYIIEKNINQTEL